MRSIIIFDNRFAQSFRSSIYRHYISSNFKTLLQEKDQGVSDLSPLHAHSLPPLFSLPPESYSKDAMSAQAIKIF
jgi:hypothetical protein